MPTWPSAGENSIAAHYTVDDVAAAVAPSVIINAAAYTAVDQAESQEASAYSINRDGAAALAASAAKVSIPFIQLSTDYVFDGRKQEPYEERDIPAPLKRSNHWSRRPPSCRLSKTGRG